MPIVGTPEGRPVCCKLRAGWIIQEEPIREVWCPRDDLAITCCERFASSRLRMWDVVDALDQPCDKPGRPSILPPIGLVGPPKVSPVVRPGLVPSVRPIIAPKPMIGLDPGSAAIQIGVPVLIAVIPSILPEPVLFPEPIFEPKPWYPIIDDQTDEKEDCVCGCKYYDGRGEEGVEWKGRKTRSDCESIPQRDSRYHVCFCKDKKKK